MSALETLVPVVGSINERRPPQEQDWVEAENTGVLPEVEGLAAYLMGSLLSAATRYSGLKVMQEAFVKRLILPSLDRSQVEHSRWLRLFLTKYKAPFSEQDVPRTPVGLYNWDLAFRSNYPMTGPALLADFNAYAMHQIAPHAEIAKFSAALSADVKLRKRAEVQHWLQVYARDISTFGQSRTATLLDIVESKSSLVSSADRENLIDLVMQHADALLDHYEEHAQVWDGFMTRLTPDWSGVWSVEKDTRWRSTHGRIVRHISEEIGKRKETHRILPSRTKLELWLLPFPVSDDNKSDYDETEFVVQLESTVLRLLEDSESEVLGWSAMADDVGIIPGLFKSDKLKARVASEFGKLSDSNDNIDATAAKQALNLIKVEVAMRLFDQCTDVEVVKSAQGRERLTEWRTCGSDLIRKRVFRWEGKKRIDQK